MTAKTTVARMTEDGRVYEGEYGGKNEGECEGEMTTMNLLLDGGGGNGNMR